MKKRFVLLTTILVAILVMLQLYTKAEETKYDFVTMEDNIESVTILNESKDVQASSFIKTTDGYVVIGCKYNNVNWSNYAIIMKYDKEGNIEWQSEYESGAEDSSTTFDSIIETIDGFVVIGTDNYSGKGIIVKYDKEGNAEWQKEYQDESLGYGYLKNVLETSDGYIVTGGYYENEIIMKYDKEGNVEWQSEYESGAEDSSTTFDSIIETIDGFVVIGTDNYSGKGIIVKYDKEGNIEWQKAYESEDDYNSSVYNNIIETTDGYIVVGADNIYSGKGIVVKYDKEGNISWQKAYESEDDYNSSVYNNIIETTDGYVVVGIDNYSGNGIIVKYDKEGNIKWKQNYTGEYYYFSNFDSIVEVEDGYIVSGVDNSYSGYAGYKTSIVKYDFDGNILYDIQLETIDVDVTLEGDIALSFNSIVGDFLIVKLFSEPSNDSKNTESSVSELSYKDLGIEVQWEREYESSNENNMPTFNSVIETEDGFVVVGIDNYYDGNGIITKYDKEGNVLWQKQYQDENLGYVYFENVVETSDGYIVTGDSYENAIIIKYDKEGNVLWHKQYESYYEYGDLEFNSIVEDDDGYVVVGSDNYGASAIIIKCDKLGNIIWKNYLVNLSDSYGQSVFNSIIESENGYIVVGNLNIVNYSQKAVDGNIIIKYDKEGNIEWKSIDQFDDYNSYNSVVETNDGYIVVGSYEYKQMTSVEKYDKEGNILFEKSYSNITDFSYITKAKNKYYAVGETYEKSFLVELDKNGDGNIILELENKDYLTAINSVVSTSDGFVIVGNNGNAFIEKYGGLEEVENRTDIDHVVEYVDEESAIIKLFITSTNGVSAIIFPDDTIKYFDNEKEIEQDYEVFENSEYLFKIIDADGNEFEEIAIVDLLKKKQLDEEEDLTDNQVDDDNDENQNEVEISEDDSTTVKVDNTLKVVSNVLVIVCIILIAGGISLITYNYVKSKNIK